VYNTGSISKGVSEEGRIRGMVLIGSWSAVPFVSIAALALLFWQYRSTLWILLATTVVALGFGIVVIFHQLSQDKGQPDVGCAEAGLLSKFQKVL
jgi:hypothetical protein